ncbi:MAG TPA: hypothetical protein VGZ52_12945 [Acidimicrobiales bacterium]|jgi:hypothetical protein|nr:hypothetical protein [Acidimicrobiales bacterium]
MSDPEASADPAAVRRELLVLLRRLAGGPLTLEAGLQGSAAVRRGIEALQDELVATARGEGASWAAIGAALGVSTQAAHQRFSSSV